ncbi:DUF4320 family protein [Ruminococcaceae bacterium OttesenSCG-928-L11]|nr:DUF4320 family protein [Ruminococcaceae bacterium OttesenSCG-928-L11]
MCKKLLNRRGEGYIDVAVVVLVAMLCLALVVRVSPVFVAKNHLDAFASELVREAEIAGRVGSETTARANELKSQMGITPTVSWSRTGNIQLDGDITVTCTITVNIGLFGDFGSFPIELKAVASGKSEVYWK